MGAEVFHGRVRDGIGCIILAMTTGPPGRILVALTGRMRVGVGSVCACVVGEAGGARLGAARGRCGCPFRTNTLAGAVLGGSGALSGD
jgi:hypothetical protein